MAQDGRDEQGVKLLRASFRGERFYVRDVTTTGGRKANERPIINSDEQVVDDVGLMQRTYVVRGFVTARYEGKTSNESGISVPYDELRKRLLKALENRDPGILVHPIQGEIRGVIAKSWTLDETITDVGVGQLVVTFVVETTRPVVQAETGNEDSVDTAASEAEDAALNALAEKWHVSVKYVKGYQDALAKVQETYDRLEEVAKTAESYTDEAIGAATQPLANFAQTVAGLTASAASIVTAPIAIVDGLRTAFNAFNSVFPTATAAFRATQNAFEFGQFDIEFDLTTPSGRQKKQNYDAMNTAFRTLALCQAYRWASQLEFTTVDEVDEVQDILEAQHQAMVTDPATSSDVVASLVDARDEFSRFIRNVRLTAKKVVVDDIATLTPRALAYAFYGEDADDYTAYIKDLNGVESYALLRGSARVLTP